jgi:hypothetical protein
VLPTTLATLSGGLSRILMHRLLRMDRHLDVLATQPLMISVQRDISLRRTVLYQDTRNVIVGTDTNGNSNPSSMCRPIYAQYLDLDRYKAVSSQSPTILRPCRTLSTHLLASDIKTSFDGKNKPVSTCCSRLLSVVHSSESNERFRRYC